MFYDADAMRCRLHTEAVAQETMRLLPVAPLQGAEPIEDTLIGDVLVPKGTPIYLLAGRAAKMAAAFSEPRAFNPQRWLSGGHHASAGHDPHAFFPFGGGPRVCPGLVEGLRTLRAPVLDKLLGYTTRIKVARLADQLAQRADLPWANIARRHSARLGGGERWLAVSSSGERIDLRRK